MPTQDALLAVCRPYELGKMKPLLWFCEFQAVTKPAGSLVSGKKVRHAHFTWDSVTL